MILLPSTPSGPDVESLQNSYQMLTSEDSKFHHKNVGAVLTQVFTNYRITKEALEGLKELRIPLLAQVGHRTVYQIVATDGTTVFDAGDKKAIREIEALGKIILSSLKLKVPR